MAQGAYTPRSEWLSSSFMQPTQQHTLPRVLGPWIATAIIVGTVIGSGVFVKGRKVANSVEEFSLIMGVWILGGVHTPMIRPNSGTLSATFRQIGRAHV